MDMETLVAWLDEQIRLCDRGLARAEADLAQSTSPFGVGGAMDRYKNRGDAFRATRGFIIREEEGSN